MRSGGPLFPIALIVLHFQATFIFNWRIIIFQYCDGFYSGNIFILTNKIFLSGECVQEASEERNVHPAVRLADDCLLKNACEAFPGGSVVESP